jgi:DNA-binding NtrC family response regulator
MKEGARDFLAKPVDPDHLLLLVERAIAQRRLVSEYNLLKADAAARRTVPTILGEAPVLKQALATVQRAAGTDTTVLLEGESGTGKELFARALHALGDRAEGPFVAINCAAIPEPLLEAELFGYERGAFTGAQQRKPGKFELAHRGTLFLDEIGELPMGVQSKLLRVIETRSFDRLGGTATVHVDVRLVAATNRHLRQAVAARQFREDLYFRLSVLPVTIPPLRDRRGDIPILARFFVEKASRELGKKPLSIADSALDVLMAHPWPGNVRELQNAIERAVILADADTLQPRHLSLTAGTATPAAADPWAGVDLSGTMAQALERVASTVERRKIASALQEAKGDRGRAADLLRIGFKALAAKIRQYGLE